MLMYLGSLIGIHIGAYGTKVVKASFACEDAEGKDFESEVKKLEGVNEVQVEECGLVS